MDIKIISSDIDGLELRKEKASSKYYVHCDGRHDFAEINNVIEDKKVGKIYSIPARAWDRIFGRK